jgi:STE20-related kinase adapter protein alpha
MNNLHSDPRHYQLLTLIGHGSYGGVLIWLARHTASGRPVAVRTVDLDQCELPFSQIENEIKMHRHVQHKNILAAIDCFTNRNEIWMVLPLMSYGSCRDLLHAHFKDGLPEMAVAHILRDVLRALSYLHMRGKIHRDIKASHILVQSDGSVCLSGLRHVLSMISHGRRLKVVHDFPDHYVHSLNWASREMLEQNLGGYDTKSDIYSIGITACELANGVVPFQDMPLTQMLLSKIEGTTPRLLDTTTLPELQDFDGKNSAGGTTEDDRCNQSMLPYKRTFTTPFHQFVDVCLLQDPSSRPTAATLEGHAFFKQVHRKFNPPSLPELLKPLNPITADSIPVSGDPTAVETIAHTLDDMSLDTDWTF